MTLAEKAAFLKGLAEGTGIDDGKEAKLWTKLTDLLADMAHEIEELQACNEDMADALDEVGEELSYLEEITCDLDTPEDFEDYDDFDWHNPWGDGPDCDGECDKCPGCEEFMSGEDGEKDDNVVSFLDFEKACDAPAEEPEEPAEEESAEEDGEPIYDGVEYDVTCPACGEEIVFDEKTLKEGFIVCPACKERLEFDLSEE